MSPVIIAFAAVVSVALLYWTWKQPRLAVIVFWSFFATVLVCVAGIMRAPGQFLERLLWATAAAPLLWVALMFWTYWARRVWVPTAAIISLAFAGAAMFVLTDVVGGA